MSILIHWVPTHGRGVAACGSVRWRFACIGFKGYSRTDITCRKCLKFHVEQLIPVEGRKYEFESRIKS